MKKKTTKWLTENVGCWCSGKDNEDIWICSVVSDIWDLPVIAKKIRFILQDDLPTRAYTDGRYTKKFHREYAWIHLISLVDQRIMAINTDYDLKAHIYKDNPLSEILMEMFSYLRTPGNEAWVAVKVEYK